jgi:hypothetical protein
MKHKYFILYNNNTFESVSKIDGTLLRLIDSGIIILIYDIEKNIVKGKTKDGIVNLEVPFIE